MNDDYIKKIISEFTDIELIGKEKIPDIDLYMDQIITIFEENLKDYKRDGDDKILTKTMINNYVKDKIIPPPLKKKYSKSHIILLIMIYHLKSIASIGDIGRLLNESTDSPALYDGFLKLQQFQNDNILNDIIGKKNVISGFADEQSEDLLFIMLLIIEANIRKRIAEKLIDGYFNM